MLICLFWLERIDGRLPDLMANKFNQQLKAGLNILDLGKYNMIHIDQ